MISYKKTNRGLVKMIILILVVLLLLAYFRVNVRNLVTSAVWADNWDFVKGIAINIWENILKVPATYLWDKIFTSSTK